MGTTEIVFILLIYLLLFGTKGLPSMAQSMGKFMRQVRDAQQDIQREILSGTDDLRKGAAAFRDPVGAATKGFEDAIKSPAGTPRSSSGTPADGPSPPEATEGPHPHVTPEDAPDNRGETTQKD
ncbi:twin-arginine translocase TatA/TatE family subunit [Flavobacteriales bacterium]|nr:twin-arginine translocase TatA/TatE family subunit [Flavobacteriales bacterium]